jgi:hypothetical protein
MRGQEALIRSTIQIAFDNRVALQAGRPFHYSDTSCLVPQDLALLTKVRTLIHEEISFLALLDPNADIVAYHQSG